MEVAYWQAFVFVTVATVTSVFGARAGLIAAIAWTLFTIIMIYTSSLMILQFGTIWIAYALFRERGLKKDLIAKQSGQISTLESALAEALRDYDASTRDRAKQAIKDSKYEVIRDKQHRDELLKAVADARDSLLIVSGWIRSYVVDKRFLRDLTAALRRGVNVIIHYGWQKSDGTHDSDTSITQARDALNSLSAKSRRKRGWGHLVLREYPTHEKAIVKDADYVIFGSNNWLSNRKFRNREQSIKIWDKDLAQQVLNQYRSIDRH